MDPGPPPQLGDDPAATAAFQDAAIGVLRASSDLDAGDGATVDIGPGAMGDNPLGTNDGHGHATNPETGEPYAPDVVLRGDFARVLTEFWADGPDSETPPGHWNTLANQVSDTPGLALRIGGEGPEVDRLEWDVKLYFALNGAVHDAAVAAWGAKGYYDSARPISMIRWMGGRGQSSDPAGPAYDPQGLPLVPDLVEVVTAESSAPGQRHENLAGHVGEVAVRAWQGNPDDPATTASGAGWIRAVDWVPYQKPTFVTPAFAGYVSGHSTFSRAAAEVMTAYTGSPWFPGGMSTYTAPAGSLGVEAGPTQDVDAAVGDVLRRRRPGRPVPHLRRDPHHRRRLRRPRAGLRLRPGCLVPGPAVLRGRRPLALLPRPVRRAQEWRPRYAATTRTRHMTLGAGHCAHAKSGLLAHNALRCRGLGRQLV